MKAISTSIVFLAACAAASAATVDRNVGPKAGEYWQAVHKMVAGNKSLDIIEKQLPALAGLGVNVLICEVNYNFDFKSHPKLRNHPGAITKARARKFAAACRKHGIRVIPMLNCVGHQSYRKKTASLLRQYPHFDETPGKFPGNKGISFRNWCTLHPDVNRVVFALMDELIGAFEADAFHVGMDEIFLIGSEHCKRCKGKDPAKLLARAINDYHKHLKAKGVEMLMWGDRLIDQKSIGTNLNRWESSANGTAPAIDLIPTDIILCPWRYTRHKEYPSIPMMLKKGFRVLPAGWNKTDAVEALIDCSLAQKNPRMLGYMATTWSVNIGRISEYLPLIAGIKRVSSQGARKEKK